MYSDRAAQKLIISGDRQKTPNLGKYGIMQESAHSLSLWDDEARFRKLIPTLINAVTIFTFDAYP